MTLNMRFFSVFVVDVCVFLCPAQPKMNVLVRPFKINHHLLSSLCLPVSV